MSQARHEHNSAKRGLRITPDGQGIIKAKTHHEMGEPEAARLHWSGGKLGIEPRTDTEINTYNIGKRNGLISLVGLIKHDMGFDSVPVGNYDLVKSKTANFWVAELDSSKESVDWTAVDNNKPNRRKKVRTRHTRSCYHTEPECHNYPENPIAATESDIQWGDLHECRWCKLIQEQRESGANTENTLRTRQ